MGTVCVTYAGDQKYLQESVWVIRRKETTCTMQVYMRGQY